MSVPQVHTATSDVTDLSVYVPRLSLHWETVAGEDPRHTALDASMVFVDISGFTALSERLASFGRVGAEEITDLLQHVFTRLLAVAYENDGSLLKFGGDALLLLFVGDNHELRAAHSAAGMRRKLRELGELDSMAGKVRLGMTVGAHSGRFDFFLVGDSHLELVVAGPASSRVVELEGAAEQGEVMVSPETAAHLGTDLLVPGRAGGSLLTEMPTPPRVPHDVFAPKAAADAASILLPTGLRRFLEAGGGGAEHRQAVVAFLAFKGTDDLITTEGPAACAEVLDDLVRRTAAACDEHDITFLGSDVAEGGGKLILVAGAPVGHDDDDERILRAARQIVSSPSRLAVRIGVNPGPLFAGVVGPPYRLTYTVMGDTVNLAARLAYAVDPGHVITTASTLESTRSRFASTPVPAFHVKGKTDPIEAVIVGEPRGQRIEQTHRVPLIGRGREIARLDEHIAATADGGRVVELVGPPGIGKSRMLGELRDRHPELRLRYGHCASYESNTPYFAFRGLVRFVLELSDDAGGDELTRRLETLTPDLVPWAALVGSVVDIAVDEGPEVAALDPQFRATRLRSVIGELLTTVLPERSIVRIEDVHWIDDASRQLLEHLIRAVIPETDWLLVVTSREVTFDELVDEVIELQPLGEEAVEEFAHEAAARGLVTLDAARQLASRAGGNPLFLQELLAFEGTGDDVPDTVERLIAARIDQLAPGHRELLRHAALLGGAFDLSLLRSVTGAEVSDADLDELERFVRRDAPGEYTFEHDLYREVAYAGLPYRRRRELHDRAGRVIETRHLDAPEEVAESLALHYHRAGRHEKSWQYNRVAAQRARARYAPAEAARLLRWALESSGRVPDLDPDEVADAWQELGDLMELLGSYGRAEEAYRRARRMAAPDRRPALWHRSGIVREREGRLEQALRWYTRAERALEGRVDPESRRLSARVRLRKAEVRIIQGRKREVQQRVRELLPEAEDLGSPELLARVHFVLAWVLQGEPEAAEHQRSALSLYRDVEDLVGQANVHLDIGIAAYHDGDWASARDQWTRAQELKLAAGNEVGAGIAISNVGEILSDQGRFDEAEDAFHYALRLHRAAGFQLGIGMSLGNLGRLASRRGEYDVARTTLEEAHRVLGAARLEKPAREMRARLAEAAGFGGDVEGAREHALYVLEAVGNDANPESVVASRALVLASAWEERAPASTELRAVRDRAVSAESTHELLLADVLLAWCLGGQDDEASARFRAAATERAEMLGLVIDPLVLAVGPDLAQAGNRNHA
ncbi:MAG: AAA family ATPase [Actinobacteria bacterium]|nr:AAA family ATPase [Actinomycetota bacterium]